MIEVLVDGSQSAKARLAKLEGRCSGGAKVEATVRKILETVRRQGDRALLRYTKRFDGVELKPTEIEVPRRMLKGARRQVAAATWAALEQAHTRIRNFQQRQVTASFEIREQGLRTGLRPTPLAKVGVYVPGGRAAYPSSVLMNVVPARVAGVQEIVVVSPPTGQGLRPEVLAAAELAGAHRVLQVGGAQAIAALAYGTESVPRVDKIVGPGNVYVATAKRLVFGSVGVDMVAGPTEVLIVADGSARADFIAADMLAQAEHDPNAAALCITTERSLAREVVRQLCEQLASLTRRAIATRSLRRHGTLLVVRSLMRAAELANRIAPEHLELFVHRPRSAMRHFSNAGAIFLGQYTTEALGDYLAGPNHVLPTGGAARFSSPLGVYDFVKWTSIIEATPKGLGRMSGAICELARSEGLDGHARAALLRSRPGGR